MKGKVLTKYIIVFLQDDEIAMDFVTCAANIRAHIFSIGTKTRFDIKCKFLSLLICCFAYH